MLVTAGGMPHGPQTIGRSICGVSPPPPIPRERIFQKEFPGQWNLFYTFKFVWFDSVSAHTIFMYSVFLCVTTSCLPISWDETPHPHPRNAALTRPAFPTHKPSHR